MTNHLPLGAAPSSSLLWLSRTKAFFLGAIAVAGTALLVAACSKGTDSGACSINGVPCTHGCFPGVGCGDCGSNTDCSPNQPFCTSGVCVACRTAADCAVGQSCFLADGQCHTACTSNAQCPGDAPICDPTTKACVGCTSNTSCSPTQPICDTLTAQCSECATNADCSAASPICDLVRGRCEQCLSDGDCMAGYLCGGDHQCHAGCKSNTDCGGDRPICDTTTGACIGCTSATDCGAAAPFCTMAGVCVECLANTDCKKPGVPFCDPTGLCVQCLGGGPSSQGCPAGLKCKGGFCG